MSMQGIGQGTRLVLNEMARAEDGVPAALRREVFLRPTDSGLRVAPLAGGDPPLRKPRAIVDELIRRAYWPAATLQELLGALFGALAEHTHATGGQLWMRDWGTLVVGRNGSALTSDWLGHPGEPAHAGASPGNTGVAVDDAVRNAEWSEVGAYREGGEAAPAPVPLVVPLVGRRATVGELRLQAPPGREGEAHLLELLREFARACVLFERRYQVERWTRQHLGQPLLLVGVDPAVRAVEEFVEKAAGTRIPVLIRGEFGTEKTLVAVAIHSGGADGAGNIVEVHCAAQSATEAIESLPQAVEKWRGGTLFLNGIDELPMHAQKQLLRQLHSSLGQWVGGGEHAEAPRLIASVTADVHELAEQGHFSKALLAELDFLAVTVPPLRDRPDDIEAHLGWLLGKYGWRAQDKCTPALVESCRAHGWSDNLIELERAVARLAVMTGSRPIERTDLAQHTPWLASAATARVDANGQASATPLTAAERWARHLADGTASDRDFHKLHDSLQRALRYLGEHWHDAITLGQLARHARVSGSHLSYLFRNTLGTTFKELLGRIRIEKARHALAEDPRARITDVAMDSGFTDLSHFEKLFRRTVGESPREYRRRMAGEA